MSRKDQPSFVSDVETPSKDLAIRRPFKLAEENRRRFVRLEIASPITLQKIKEADGEFTPKGGWHIINGTILNLSAGGVLVEADQILFEGDIVSMGFTFQQVERLDRVVGLVKRVDADDGLFLAGIEFVTREQLCDVFSQGEIDLLPADITGFGEGVRNLLNRHIYREPTNESL